MEHITEPIETISFFQTSLQSIHKKWLELKTFLAEAPLSDKIEI